MCLGIPMQIKSIDGFTACCEAKGVERDVSLFMMQEDPLQVDDFIVVHVGYAIQKSHPRRHRQPGSFMTRCWKLRIFNMHELAICQSLMNQVEGIVLEHEAKRATSIIVGMGALSGVEAELLKNAFSIASAGTVADGAELIIENLPVRVKCTQCGSESDVLPNKLTCKQCGDWQTTVISGDELMLMSVELEREPEQANDISKPGFTVH